MRGLISVTVYGQTFQNDFLPLDCKIVKYGHFSKCDRNKTATSCGCNNIVNFSH